jgi:hypothetical protein
MLNIGDIVKTNAVNGETFIGEVIGLDRYGFATVTFSGISESRIQLIHLTKENK